MKTLREYASAKKGGGNKICSSSKSRRHIYYCHANRAKLYCILITTLLIAFPAYAIAPKAPETPKIAVLNHNTLKPISTINYQQNKTLGAISEDLFSGLKYRTIIKCLAKLESGYRTDVYGDKGLAYGILQYHKPTFNRFCTGNYYSAQDQIRCCDAMLTRDFNLISHWTTAKLCLTKQ